MNNRLKVYESLLYKTNVGHIMKEIKKPEYWPRIAPEDFVPIPGNVEAFARQFEEDIDMALFAVEEEIQKMHTFAENFTDDREHPLFAIRSLGLRALENVLMLLEDFTIFSLNNFDYYWKRRKQETYIQNIGRISGLEAMKRLKLPQTNFDHLEEALKQYKNVISKVLNRLNDEFVAKQHVTFNGRLEDGRAHTYSFADLTRKKIHGKILEKALAVHTKDERDQLRLTMRYLFPSVRPPGPLPTK